MDDTMAPPSKRRKLLDMAEIPAQASESARTFLAPFSHGVEHIPASQPTQAPIARSPPHHVEELHLQIHKRSILAAEERLLKRQGTAALSDIISTNSNADVVVAVTASVDALGSTTALATAAVTVDIPDLGPLLSTSSTTAVISGTSRETTSSTASATSSEASSSEESSPSEAASSSDSSRSSSVPSSTSGSESSTSGSSNSQQTYAISPASENSNNDAQGQSQSSTSTGSDESTSGSSVATSSTASTVSESSNASSSQPASLSAYTSSNSSMVASTSGTSGSAVTSGYLSQTGSSSPINSLNLTTSALTSTSGSAVLVSVVTVSSSDSSSSIDLNALYLATQSNGDVTTITRSDEPFTTSLADGQAATIPPSSSGSVTVISSGGSTVRSTVFSTASPSSTQSSSDETNGVGLAGVAGDGATATSGGASSTSAPAKNNGDDNTAPAGTIAGGVVGGAAGLVLVGLIILLFLRRYKKRVQLGHQALPANSAGPLTESDAGTSSSAPGMAERAGLMPFAGAVPALFRHQNRQNESETGERGFQRVSGRKLPSAFSEGMAGPPHPPTSPPPTMPLVSPEDGDRNLSSLSFYRDSAGFYGGDGSSTSPDPFSDTNIPATVARNEAAEQLIMSPGPQRRPTIHAPKSNVQVPSVATSGTPSWTPSHTATFARSETPASLDSGRNSRFTEEV